MFFWVVRFMYKFNVEKVFLSFLVLGKNILLGNIYLDVVGFFVGDIDGFKKLGKFWVLNVKKKKN